MKRPASLGDASMILDQVFKNGPSKVYGRQHAKYLR